MVPRGSEEPQGHFEVIRWLWDQRGHGGVMGELQGRALCGPLRCSRDSLDTLTLQGCCGVTGEPFEVTEGMVRSRKWVFWRPNKCSGAAGVLWGHKKE